MSRNAFVMVNRGAMGFRRKDKDSDSREEIIRKINRSVVCINTDAGMGAGFFIDYNGILATNRHVVEGCDAVEIVFHDETTTVGRVVYRDPSTDIAFVAAAMKTRPPLQAETARSVEQGTDVMAIGHPLGLEYSVLPGIISALARDIDGCSYLQISVLISPGNSGGPLIDLDGRLVGMCTLGLKDHPGLNFAVPVDELMKRYRSIKAVIAGEEEAPSECPYCSSINAVAEEYCANCGAKLPFHSIDAVQPMAMGAQEPKQGTTNANQRKVLRRCSSCGKRNKEREDYCQNCGFHLLKK